MLWKSNVMDHLHVIKYNGHRYIFGLWYKFAVCGMAPSGRNAIFSIFLNNNKFSKLHGYKFSEISC